MRWIHQFFAKANVNSSTVTATFPPTYAFPVIVAKPNRSSKFTKFISMTRSSPGVTGVFQRTPLTPVKKNNFPPPSLLIGGDKHTIPPKVAVWIHQRKERLKMQLRIAMAYLIAPLLQSSKHQA